MTRQMSRKKPKCQFHRWGKANMGRQTCLKCGRTRLAKGSGTKGGTRLRPVSGQRKAIWAQYRAALKDRARGATCANCGAKRFLEPHHPYGRRGENLLRFVFICRSLHHIIHAHSDAAKEAGWLQPEYSGRIKTGGEPEPWLYAEDGAIARWLGFACKKD